MKKKILFMISSMNIGGVEKSLLSLLSVIPKEQYDVTVLLLEKKGGFLNLIPNWVRVEEVDWFSDIKPIIMQSPYVTIKNYYNTCCYKQMISFFCTYFIDKQTDNRYLYYKQIFKKVPKNYNRYDLAISYQGPTDIIDYYIANKVDAYKRISWIHFDVSQHIINKKYYQKLYEKYDKLIVVSKEAKNRLAAIIPNLESKAEVFLNIVPKNLIREMSKETVDFDDEYKGIKIVTVGRLSKEKGQDIAIKTLYMLRRNGYDVRWYCIGEGKERKEYEISIDKYKLKQDFILLGATTNPYPFISKADIYVQTSRHEGYCLTLAEAKYLQKPIITTNFIGAYEQIEDGKNGFIVGDNKEELYLKIKFLIENKKVKDRLIKNSKTDILNANEEIIKLFDKIV